MKELGIGRPSTYTRIVDKIQRQGSVRKWGRYLAPTFYGLAVDSLMRKYFHSFADADYTAKMEQGLDKIACGELDGNSFLWSLDQEGGGIVSSVNTASKRVDGDTFKIVTSPKWKNCTVFVDKSSKGAASVYVKWTVNGEVIKRIVPNDWLPADVTEEMLMSLP